MTSGYHEEMERCEHFQLKSNCWYCEIERQLKALIEMHKSINIQCAANRDEFRELYPDADQPHHVLKMHERIDYVLLKINKLDKAMEGHQKQIDDVIGIFVRRTLNLENKIDELKSEIDTVLDNQKLLDERIDTLENAYNKHLLNFVNGNDKKPNKCPVCDGTRLCHNKDSGLSWQCESCEGKGIVWG